MSYSELRLFLQAKVDACELLTTYQVRQMVGCTKLELSRAIHSKALPAIKLKDGHSTNEYILTADDVLQWAIDYQHSKNVINIRAIKRFKA